MTGSDTGPHPPILPDVKIVINYLSSNSMNILNQSKHTIKKLRIRTQNKESVHKNRTNNKDYARL